MKFKIEVLIAKQRGIEEIRTFFVTAASDIEAEAKLETLLAEGDTPEYGIFSFEEIFPDVRRPN